MKKPFRVWAEGVTIRSPRIIEAFDQGILVRRVRVGNSILWYAKCEHPGCTDSYNLSMTREAGFRRKRCRKHSRLVMVAGHTTNIVVLAEYADRVVWRPHKYNSKGGVVPYIRCAVRGCTALSIYKPSVTVYRCVQHGSTHKRLRPYEALFNAWRSAHARRNEKRSSALLNTLTYQQFVRICRAGTACYYCGKKVERPKYNHTRGTEKARSSYLDRVDATKGYSKNNVVTCCGSCNFSKNNFISYEEMVVIGAMRDGDVERACDLVRKHRVAHVAWQEIVSAYGIYKNFGRKPDEKTLKAVKAYFDAQLRRRTQSQ